MGGGGGGEEKPRSDDDDDDEVKKERAELFLSFLLAAVALSTGIFDHLLVHLLLLL